MTKSLSGSGSNANAAETKQILLKEIRAKWGKLLLRARPKSSSLHRNHL